MFGAKQYSINTELKNCAYLENRHEQLKNCEQEKMLMKEYNELFYVNGF